jgi:hypothetical protein
VDATFEAPGSLGIVFGNFGKHDTVLIKEITPGYQCVFCRVSPRHTYIAAR